MLNLRKGFLSALVVGTLLLQMANTIAVRADGDTPPTDTPAEVSTEPADGGTTEVAPPDPTEADPTEAPSQDPTEVVTQDATDPAVTPDATLESDPTEAPTSDPSATPEATVEADPTETGQPTSLPEILDQAPDNTQVVVLNSDGQPEPLATQSGVQILANGDPMWCPQGVLPGGAGCTTSFNSFTGASGLLNTLAGGAYSGNGVIYVAQNYDSSLEIGDVGIDGSVLTTLQNLTIQGGWDGVLGSANITGTSLFNNLILQITNWNYNVSINDIEVANSSQFGLGVDSSGNIALDNVNAHDNSADGVILQTYAGAGNVTVTNSTVDNNGANGLIVGSGGNVSLGNVTTTNNNGDGVLVLSEGNINLNHVTSTNNSGIGADLESCGCTPGDVNVNNSEFSSNSDDGLDISTDGNVTVTNTEANNNNNGAGTDISAGGNVALVNVGAFTNGSGGIYIENQGNTTLNHMDSGYNGDVGVGIFSNGNVSVNDTWAGYNNSVGLGLDAAGNVTLTNSAFFDNVDPGAMVTSSGSINVNNSFFGNCFLGYCGTQPLGALFLSTNSVAISNSQFNQNTDTGLVALSFGNVTLTNVSADGNGSLGADIQSLGNVTICGGSYSYNGDTGLAIDAQGAANISPSTLLNGNGVMPTDIMASAVNENFRCSPKHRGGSYNSVNVSDGVAVEASCDGYIGVELHLPSGDSLVVPCPTHGKASLAHIAFGQLPGALPEGDTFISALLAQAARDGLTVSFALPVQGAKYTILRWNGSEWINLDGVTTIDGLYATVPATPGYYVLVTK